MRFNFADTSRPARMSKLVRTAFAEHGRPLGLSGAQDVCARMYGYPTYHELKACVGRCAPCRWDEQVPDEVASNRRAWQVSSLATDGLPLAAAEGFVDDNRPTGTSRRVLDRSPVGVAPPNPIPAVLDADVSVERLIRCAIDGGVTDIHIEPKPDSYAVFFRRLGERVLARVGTRDEYATVVSELKDRSRMDLAERRVGQDGGFQIEYSGKYVDLRVATVPAVEGEQVIIRVLDPDRVRPKLEALGISGVKHWRRGITRKNGLCLICGETGSGKTTTINASVRELDRFGKKIYTAEDPVEYRIPYVGQVSMNSGVGYGFAQAIRNFMKTEPQVMVLGEVRDPDTARNAVKAAETGHLVIATLNAGTIAAAVSRLHDLGVPPFELRFILRSVLVQTLVKVTCKGCDGTGHVASGACPTCFGTGYSDRTLASECHSFGSFHEFDDILAKLNRPGVDPDSLPWIPLLDDAIDKMLAGIVDADEMRRVFGQVFLDRCRARGIDPAAHARRKH